MGLRIDSKDVLPSRTMRPLPIQGMLRRSNKSLDRLTALLPAKREQLLSGKNLSKSTLQKIFAAMLGVVFICYCVLMMLMMRHHEKSVFDTEGKWGPAGTMETSRQVLRNHIQELVDERRQTIDDIVSQRKSSSEVQQLPEQSQNIEVGPRGQSGNINRQFFENLEETDIHDMIPPEAIQHNDKAQKRQFSEKKILSVRHAS